jgi:hypothetical protein
MTAGATSATVATSATTSSTSFSATPAGPNATVTVPASGNVIVILTAQVTPPASQSAFMSFSATGVVASDARSLMRQHGTSSSTGGIQASAIYFLTGLTPGSLTFTSQYRVTGGTGTFANRNITVIPMP